MADSSRERGGMVRGGAFALALKGAYVAAQFGVGVLLARSLGPVGLGTYAFVMAIVQVLVIAGQWGVPALLVRQVALALQAARIADAKADLASGFALVALTSLLAGALFLLGTTLFDRDLAWASGPVAALVSAMALGSVIGGAMRGLGHIVPSLLAEETLRLWLLLAAVTVFLASGATMTPASALVAHAVAAGVALAVAMFLLHRRLPVEMRGVAMVLHLGRIATLGFPFLLLLGAQTLSYQTGTIMLGLLQPGAPVGLYRTAFQIAEAVGILLFAVSTVIGPHLARAEADPARLRAILIGAHRIGVVMVLPALLVVLLLGRTVMAWVFGAEFAVATQAMQILVVGKLFYAATAFVGLALSMIGRAWTAAAISAAVIVANVVLCLALIPRFGIEGVAVADATSNFLVAGLGAIYLRRLFDGKGVTAFAAMPKRD